MAKNREQLLLRMYDQMYNDINRHIMVSWQAIALVAGSFALLSFGLEGTIPFDIAIAILVALAGWMMHHVYDSSYWYNRNLVIITNIEKEFLDREDLKKIHPYFSAFRKNNKMISHLRIHRNLGALITLLILGYHFYLRILPGMRADDWVFDPLRALPYLILMVVVGALISFRNDRNGDYNDFINKAKGKTVESFWDDPVRGHAQKS